MSERKSRIGLDPPAQFWADVITFLSLTYPEATIDKETVRELRPHLIGQWRMGQNAAKSAAATCSCDGKRIVPSPASRLELKGRIARPPAAIAADMVFGYEDLRPPRRIEQARISGMVAERQAEFYAQEQTRLQAELSQGLAPKRERQVQKLIARAESMAAKYRLQANTIAASLLGFGVPGRGGKSLGGFSDSVSPKSPVSKAPRAENPTPPVPKRAKRKSESVERAEEKTLDAPVKRRKKACTECSTGPEPLPSEDLNALQGLIDSFADAAISDISKKST